MMLSPTTASNAYEPVSLLNNQSQTCQSQDLNEEEVIVFVEWNYKLSIRQKAELESIISSNFSTSYS